MMEKEQVKPLAPATDHHHSSDDEETIFKKITCRRKYIKWLSCMVAVITIMVVVIVTLIFTVFKIKEPQIKLNGVSVSNFGSINGTIPQQGTNISLIADISVKNPNFASFRYENTTTTLYYHEGVIGVARGLPGRSKARRTTRMNITVDIGVYSLLGSPNLQSDLGAGFLTMSSYTRVDGRVKIMNLIKKHVSVRMNCTMKVDITSTAIEDQKCNTKVKL